MAGQEHDARGGLETTAERDEGREDGSLGTARRLFDPVITAWMAIVRAFSWAIARIVAVVLFVVGFVPYSVVMRLVRFDPLDRRLDPETESYWKEAGATNDDMDSFRKQY